MPIFVLIILEDKPAKVSGLYFKERVYARSLFYIAACLLPALRPTPERSPDGTGEAASA